MVILWILCRPRLLNATFRFPLPVTLSGNNAKAKKSHNEYELIHRICPPHVEYLVREQ